MRRASVFLLAVLLGIGLSTSAADANCRRHSCVRPTPGPTASPRPTPTVAPTTSSTAGGYSFDEEFDGTALSSKWDHAFTCCGVTVMDPQYATVSSGYLHLAVVNRSGTWYSSMVDTKTTFTQTYGYFAARMAIPEGTGLWPAFWLYLSGGDELDAMEVCDNPPGANGGNDVTLLHTTVHQGTQANQVGAGYRTGNLSLAFHTYAVDWRPSYVAFYLDGVQVYRETSLLVSTPKAVLLDLGLGGSWCGDPTSTTPSSSEMLVDWVRVSP